jgi:hypothetical protein
VEREHLKWIQQTYKTCEEISVNKNIKPIKI